MGLFSDITMRCYQKNPTILTTISTKATPLLSGGRVTMRHKDQRRRKNISKDRCQTESTHKLIRRVKINGDWHGSVLVTDDGSDANNIWS
mmetsp:Transcript_2015/g.2717  ORF Transcript_2015/g.2717 Transcript_2015/m.2717 type:complete len:90 (+) Transcript_2015:1338-1607(+)